MLKFSQIIIYFPFLIYLTYGKLLPYSSPINSLTFRSIFHQFESYTLFYHFENSTKNDLDLIIACNHLAQTYFVTNYDLNLSKLIRPEVDKVFNVVFFKNPFRFQKFSEIPYNFFPFDSVFFIILSLGESPVNFWQMLGMHWSSNTMVFELTTGKLSHCCFYCGNKTGILKQRPNLVNLANLVNNYSDFNGHVFTIAYTDFPPFFSCVPKKSSACEPKGAEASLLNELSRMYNFRFRLVEYDGDRGRWQAMVEGVHARHVDWAIGGISVSLQRGTLTDFTRYIKQQGFSVLFASSPSTWLALENILMVFEWNVWLSLLMTILGIGLFTRLVVYCLKLKRNGGFMQYSRAALMSIVEQSVAHKKYHIFNAHSVKIVFMIWWLMIMCLTTMYKSQLTSMLIRPLGTEFTTVDELVEDGFEFRANSEDWSVLKENLEFSRDEVYAQLLKRIDDKLEFCDAVLSSFDGKIAVIDEETPIQYDVFTKCKKGITRRQRNRFRLLRNNLFPNSYHGWSMQTATPFRLQFSSTIGHFDDTGLIYHWYHEAFFYHLLRSNDVLHITWFNPMSFNQFLPTFFVLIIGISIGFLSLLIEFCTYYYHYKYSINRRFLN